MVVVTYYREAIVNNHPPLVAVEASTGFSMVGVPDPFSSRPNKKEEKVVWLRETRGMVCCNLIAITIQ